MGVNFSISSVWSRGEGETEAFGAFGMCVSAAGTVLAFTEGRIQWRDYDPQHIFLKRSLDGGLTWLPNQILCKSRKGEVFHNPTPVADRNTGAIFLFFALCNANRDSRIFYIRSDDEGISWNDPIDLTPAFHNDEKNRAFHLPGPGHGIQMKSGRLIVPIWHRHPIDENFLPHISERDYGNSVLFSDDGGRTWTNGGYTDAGLESSVAGQTSECRCLELVDGTLLMNARMGIPHRLAEGPNRMIKISRDSGHSWERESELVFGPSFPTDSPSITYGDEFQIFARPDCPSGTQGNQPGEGRRKLTVYLCKDALREVVSQRIVESGNTYYSDLSLLPGGTILLLYGTGFLNIWMGCEAACARFDLNWIRKG